MTQLLEATPESGRAQASVDVFGTSGYIQTYAMRQLPMTVGRAPDSDLVLASPSVSKHHGELFWRGDDLFFQDVGSFNGTRRDGERLTEPTLLRDGDELVLGGNVMLRVKIHNASFGERPEKSLMEIGLVPAELPHAEPLSFDLLPIVTKLYNASSHEELALQLTRAGGEVLGASRLALLELGAEGDRFRTVGLFNNMELDRRPLRDASFVSKTVLEETVARGLALFESATRKLSASIIASGAHSAAAATLRARDGRVRVLYADAVMGAPPLTARHAQALGLLAAHASGAFDALQARLDDARARVRFDQLRRYFSPAVVEHILAGSRDVVAKPQNVDATVLFADLVGYTKLSERLRAEPDRLMSLLNRWLDAGAEVVMEHGGTLDKFIGDCVMAVFGAPFRQDEPELTAVKCALAMRERIAAIAEETGEALSITVGINSGWLLAGNVGSKRRLEYTVLGDTVNVASRLQGQARAGEIMVGEGMLSVLEGHVELEDAGVRTLKNHGPVRAFRVLGLTRSA